MSRESKIFSVMRKQEVPKRVKEYESFGWELLSINGSDVSMSRETQNKIYAQLVKYEYQYEALIEEQDNLYCPKPVYKFSIVLFLLLSLLYIIPGLIYIGIYIFLRIRYKRAYEEYEMQYDALEYKIRQVCNDSRATFFSRNE